MATVDITRTLPEGLVREAEGIGLLRSEVLERLLREEIRRRRVEGLFAAADRLAALDLPALRAAELDAEIRAVHTARRASPARGN